MTFAAGNIAIYPSCAALKHRHVTAWGLSTMGFWVSRSNCCIVILTLQLYFENLSGIYCVILTIAQLVCCQKQPTLWQQKLFPAIFSIIILPAIVDKYSTKYSIFQSLQSKISKFWFPV